MEAKITITGIGSVLVDAAAGTLQPTTHVVGLRLGVGFGFDDARKASVASERRGDIVARATKRCAMICDKAAEMAWSRWEIRADQFDQGAAAEAEKLAEEIRKVQALEQRRAVPAA